MITMTPEVIKDKGWLVLEVVTGSKAYGLNTAKSDTDIRGVFILPRELFYSMDYTGQVSDERNDIVYYELGRFFELLSRNNPNILEMLSAPANCVLYKHEIMNLVRPEMFLSKLCEKTFANYAYTQIKKAYGLEKKIVNPIDKEKKTVLDFCYVYVDNHTIPLTDFLTNRGFGQNNVGLSVIPHLRDSYHMFYSEQQPYAGIVRTENSNDVSLSSIPKGEIPVGLLYFNKDAYSVYCKKYAEYWNWVNNRNEERYQTTMSHGKNYDSKNMMHVFRLLLMAKEIATEKVIKVFRNDRDFLLSVKEGRFEYDELLDKADKLKMELPELYSKSSLPGEPDLDQINRLLVEIRKKFYD